jgi:hypothetical protein
MVSCWYLNGWNYSENCVVVVVVVVVVAIANY